MMSRHTAAAPPSDAPKVLSPHDRVPCDTPPSDTPKVLSPHDAPPSDTPKALSPHDRALCDAPPSDAAPSAQSDWYTATLRAIVNRALDSDKPDIKGALAALQLLAETEDTGAGKEDDVARILRDARRRVIDGRQN